MTNKVKFIKVEVGGKEVTLPEINETTFTAAMRRKTYRLSEKEQGEAIFWLHCEQYLTEEQLEVLDSLDMEELAEAMKALDASKK